jgi:hypothetical protein
MAFDFNEAREIVEAAKKRGMIRADGEPAPPQAEPKRSDAGNSALPDWLREGLEKPAPRPERE